MEIHTWLGLTCRTPTGFMPTANERMAQAVTGSTYACFQLHTYISLLPEKIFGSYCFWLHLYFLCLHALCLYNCLTDLNQIVTHGGRVERLGPYPSV